MEKENIRNYKSITSFDEVLATIKTYISKDEDIEFVTRAFNFAYELHKDQKRKSGEPYINHCLSVTHILATYQSATVTLAAGLLHDTIEDCGVTYQDIKNEFNEDVADIVSAVTKIKNLPNVSLEESSASTHRKLILAMAKDVRAVIVKLCDRLHNMRTLQFVPEHKQVKTAKETLQVYAPLAHRLGMNNLKSELENLCLYYLNPQEFKIVDDLISKKNEYKNFDINGIIKNVSKILDEHSIPYRIFGRTKHIYSVYKKMYVKHNPFEKIFDLQAIRIVTHTKLQCYEILGLIHTFFKPMTGRFKDYIAMPKSNMYQSLHTTVMDEAGNLFEIQIRTEEMDYIAERGIAAHWIYKENYGQKSKTQELSEQQLSWLRDLVKMNEDEKDATDIEYMNQVQSDILETSIYVLTPKGKIIDLPDGATPVDFAYRVHTAVGHNCIGATVNKVIVPLNTELQSGDIVEIRTAKNGNGPSEDWLTFVKTSTARSQIRRAVAKRQEKTIDESKTKEALYQKGLKIFEDYCKERLFDFDVAKNHIDLSILNSYEVATKYDLFVLIGQKSIAASNVVSRLFDQNQSVEDQLGVLKKKGYVVRQEKSHGDILISGATGMKVDTAVCCKPLPGDEIKGFISRGSGIKVHRVDCPNIIRENKRLIDAVWNERELKSIYPVDIEVLSYDRNNLLVDLMGLFSSINIKIDSLSARSHYQTKTASVSCTVYLANLSSLYTLISKIKSITGVIEVNRITH